LLANCLQTIWAFGSGAKRRQLELKG